MFVAGVLVWANTIPTYYENWPTGFTCGWPIQCYLSEPIQVNLRKMEGPGLLALESFLNALIALAILTAVAVGCEGWVRRREKKLIA